MTWESAHSILEGLGLAFIPFVAWVSLQIISMGKQIIVLESKVNDAFSKRLSSLESKVTSIESKLEIKIDKIEENVLDCKLTINNLIVEKFDTMIRRWESMNKEKE
jgi:uncharacterized protein (DUF488 family)